MKTIKYLLICIWVCNLLTSCQKPLGAEPSLVSSGTLSKDNNGNCLPVNINGIYKTTTPLNATHYIDVSVNVTSAGSYDIGTDIINGIHFGDTAQFTGTGVQSVRLKGYGTPVNTGVFSFTAHYGNSSSCLLNITVSANGGPQAVFTLTGAPGACTAPIIQGSYIVGSMLDASNKLIIAANVTSIGDYTLTTGSVNGISFSTTGTFTTTGNQNITLSGSGTGLNAGTNQMTVSGSATSCSFPLTVTGPPPLDPIASFFIAWRESNANTGTTVTLDCYNPDKTLRWRRTQLGNGSTDGEAEPVIAPSIVYANGVVYYCVDSAFSTGPNLFFRYNFLYALDINTGNDIWKRRSTVDNIQNPIVRNGIIYCNIQNSAGNQVAALRATDGSLIWSKPIPEKWGAEYLELEGNMLYFMTGTANSNTQVNAFDINTKTVVWQKDIGINYNARTSKMIHAGNLIILKNGTNSLMAINKSNGATVWTKPDFAIPMFANGLIYANDMNKVFYAIMPSDGSIKYQWPASLGFWPEISNTAYVLDDNFYFTGWDPVLFTPIVASYKALSATPVLNWSKYGGPDFPERIVAAGNTVFAAKRGAIVNGLTTNTLVMYDRNSGVAQDSIVMSCVDIGLVGILKSSGTFVQPNY